jgi:hypothetical protein
MLAGKVNREPRPFRRATDAFPDPFVNTGASNLSIEQRHNY